MGFCADKSSMKEGYDARASLTVYRTATPLEFSSPGRLVSRLVHLPKDMKVTAGLWLKLPH